MIGTTKASTHREITSPIFTSQNIPDNQYSKNPSFNQNNHLFQSEIYNNDQTFHFKTNQKNQPLQQQINQGHNYQYNYNKQNSTSSQNSPRQSQYISNQRLTYTPQQGNNLNNNKNLETLSQQIHFQQQSINMQQNNSQIIYNKNNNNQEGELIKLKQQLLNEIQRHEKTQLLLEEYRKQKNYQQEANHWKKQYEELSLKYDQLKKECDQLKDQYIIQQNNQNAFQQNNNDFQLFENQDKNLILANQQQICDNSSKNNNNIDKINNLKNQDQTNNFQNFENTQFKSEDQDNFIPFKVNLNKNVQQDHKITYMNENYNKSNNLGPSKNDMILKSLQNNFDFKQTNSNSNQNEKQPTPITQYDYQYSQINKNNNYINNNIQNLNSYQNLIYNSVYNQEKGENFSDLDEKKENIKDINDTIQSPYFKPLKNNFAVNKSSVQESQTIISDQVRASNKNEKQKEYNQYLGNEKRQNNFSSNNNTNVYSSPKKNGSYKNNVYNINSNDSLSTSPINKKNEIYTGGLFSKFTTNKQKDENQDLYVLFPKIKKMDEDFIKEL